MAWKANKFYFTRPILPSHTLILILCRLLLAPSKQYMENWLTQFFSLFTVYGGFIFSWFCCFFFSFSLSPYVMAFELALLFRPKKYKCGCVFEHLICTAIHGAISDFVHAGKQTHRWTTVVALYTLFLRVCRKFSHFVWLQEEKK